MTVWRRSSKARQEGVKWFSARAPVRGVRCRGNRCQEGVKESRNEQEYLAPRRRGRKQQGSCLWPVSALQARKFLLFWQTLFHFRGAIPPAPSGQVRVWACAQRVGVRSRSCRLALGCPSPTHRASVVIIDVGGTKPPRQPPRFALIAAHQSHQFGLAAVAETGQHPVFSKCPQSHHRIPYRTRCSHALSPIPGANNKTGYRPSSARQGCIIHGLRSGPGCNNMRLSSRPMTRWGSWRKYADLSKMPGGCSGGDALLP